MVAKLTGHCHIGCALDVLPILPAGSAQMCVTSPPYWGLRDYGVEGQLGLEPTVAEYVATMTRVFAEVRRVLADDGTCWVNLGDSYAHNGACGGSSPVGDFEYRKTDREKQKMMKYSVPDGLKPKDLIGIPWRIAFALQDDGWYLRSDIIWHKPAPMPESVTDRPTRSHEYLFLLSKRARYYYDADAIADQAINAGKMYRPGNKSLSRGQADGKNVPRSGNALAETFAYSEKRNKRTVWTVMSESLPDAHFATFPRKLIEPCILAGSRIGDTVLDPFMGSGTTGQVAQDLGRDWVGIELNPEYVEIQRRRTAQQAMPL